MAPWYALEIMNQKLKDIMQNNKIFCGKIVILGGDFRQMLPIKENVTRTELISLSIKFSSLWTKFQKFELTENMRVLPEEVEFSKFVLNTGNGTLYDLDDNFKIPTCLLADPQDDIVKNSYGELIKNKDYKKASQCAILAARNI